MIFVVTGENRSSGSDMEKDDKISMFTPLVGELEKCLDLVKLVPKRCYTQTEPGKGSIGSHVRHNLDFVDAMLCGSSTGSIDYSDRGRDSRTEKDKAFAAWRIRSTILAVKAIEGKDSASLVSVRSESIPERWHCSSLSRELEFVHSHMVHHHALINERLVGLGLEPPEELGVSPATRTYRESLRLAA